MHQDEQVLMTPMEVSARLHVSRPMVYHLISRKALPCVKIGTAVRIPRDAVEQYVQRHTIEAIDG